MSDSKTPELFATSNDPQWEYDWRNTSFVKIDSSLEISNNFLCVLGGSGRHENQFKQLICNSSNKSTHCSDFHVDNGTFNKYKNAMYNGQNNAKGVLSFLIEKNDSMYIITLHRRQGYQVFDCNHDKWIIQNNKKIKPSNDNVQAIMIAQSFV